MTVNCECPCGATLDIDDASEMAALQVMNAWQDQHKNHRRTEAEYKIQMDATHRRMFE